MRLATSNHLARVGIGYGVSCARVAIGLLEKEHTEIYEGAGKHESDEGVIVSTSSRGRSERER
jgi:hypothetical protein